jgi:phage repressor protein C with HTH and peptisase S24 domain
MARLKLKQRELAEVLDIEENKVSKIKAGERQFQGVELVKARDWLSAKESAAAGRSASSSSNTRSPSADDDTVEIVALDLSLSMGPGTLIEDFVEEERVRMSLGFVQAITRTPSDRLRLVRGIGDSMEPTLRTGDRVMVDINERQLARSHGVYWIDHLGTHGIKRLRASARGKVMVMSDNPLVPDFEVDAADLRIEGRVIWFARDL